MFSIDYTVEDDMIAVEQRLEEQQKLRRILNMLTPRQKEVFYYRYVHGMKLTEICEVMRINYQSLQNLMQRSIQRVRETYALANDETEEAVREKRRMSIF
jgi:RNA polymerase sigma factor (sigma-70 family)